MRFCDLEIGQIFKFAFESDGKYIYKKVDYATLQCIEAPLCCSKAVGRVDKIRMDGCYYCEVLLPIY